MKLFAKKPCSFNGKKFFIGDEIPADHILDPKAQEKRGVIEVVEGDDSESNGPDEGGPLLPPSPTLDSDHEEEKEAYTKSSLSRMNKEKLLAIAAELGVEANAETNKERIVAMILEKQGE